MGPAVQPITGGLRLHWHAPHELDYDRLIDTCQAKRDRKRKNLKIFFLGYLRLVFLAVSLVTFRWGVGIK